MIAIPSKLDRNAVRHVVSITDSMRYTDHVATGSIVSSRFIITNALYFARQSFQASTLTAYANVDQTWDFSNPNIQRILIDKTIVHPSFVRQSLENDIAILKTLRSIDFNAFVQPIALNFLTINNQAAVLSGFGFNENTSTISVPIDSVNFKVIGNEDCKSLLNATEATRIFDSKVCVLPLDNRVICRSDNGASLTVGNDFVGVLSWNVLCAPNSPIVVERISAHGDFINEHVEF